MSQVRAAHRYALAILSVAEESKQLEPVGRDFEYLDSLLKQSREFASFTQSPVINKEKKKAVLREVLAGKVSDLTLKFLMLLASREREGLIAEIIQQFVRLRDERLGIIKATVRSAVPLTQQQQQQLGKRLEESTGKKIRLSLLEDPSLRGGFTVQYDDTVWDASVRRQLELLREKFMSPTS